MKAVIPDMNSFEIFVAKDEPSIEGSSIITLQTIEHMFNSMVKRDPLNNSLQPITLDEMTHQLKPYANVLAKRPIPFDDWHQLYLYAKKSIEHITSTPSSKLIKETAYIQPNQLKTPRTKTMNWIANKPGRNIREKLAGRKVLAEKSVFVVDTKENKVFVRVMKQLAKQFKNRMAYSVAQGKYDTQLMDEQRIEEMKRFLSFYKKVRFSDLGDLDVSKPITEPNNKLISDKHYAPIWRLYNELNNRKYKSEQKIQYLLQRFENIFMLYVVQRLNELQDLTPVNGFIELSDDTSAITVKNFDASNLRFDYFLEAKAVESVVVKTVQIGLQHLICENAKGEQVIIPASHFESRAAFGRMKAGDVLSFNNDAGGGMPHNGFNRLSVRFVKGLHISIQQFDLVEGLYKESTKSELIFQVEATDEEVQVNRGLPIMLKVSGAADSSFTAFADVEGLNTLTQYVMEELNKRIAFSQQTRNEQEKAIEEIETIAFDFTKTVPTLYVDGHIHTVEDAYLVEYVNETDQRLVPTSSQFLNKLNKPVLQFHQIFDVENDVYQTVVQNFLPLLQQTRSKQTIAPATPLLYLVPDNIDEFAQMDIKKAISIQYKKNFPIWRSISAMLHLENGLEKHTLKRTIVFDTNGPQASATQIKLQQKNADALFMHYPAYVDGEDLAEQLTITAVSRHYTHLYNEKYKLELSEQEKEHILHAGIAERCLTLHELQLLYRGPHKAPVEFEFDEMLYNFVIAKWTDYFKQYVLSLKQNILTKEEIRPTHIVMLTDFAIVEQEIQRYLKEELGEVEVIFTETQALLTAVAQPKVMQKLIASEPIWFEYLPDLSLEVIREGTYGSLPLIQNEYMGNTMGATKVFEIQETLVLAKNQQQFSFPLKRGGSLGREISAVIKNMAFPLKEDLEMKLTIEYKYGFENSYRLILVPISPHPKIKEIEVQWISEGTKESLEMDYIPVPAGGMTEEEKQVAIDVIESIFEQVSEFESIVDEDGIIYTGMILSLSRSFLKGTYSVRRLLCQLDEDTHRELNAFVNYDEYDYLFRMRKHVPEKIREGTRIKEFDRLFSEAQKFALSFGERVPDAKITKFIREIERNRRNNELIFPMLYRNSDNPLILEKAESIILHGGFNTIRAIRDMIWRDLKILTNLYKQNPEIILKLYQLIKDELHSVMQFQNENVNIKRVRDSCEVLLAIMRLRNKPEFRFMKIGSKEMRKMAKQIRDVDSLLYEVNGETIPTLLQFELEKPVGLWKLSDIGYVLNAYLTGDIKDNLITVYDISEE